MRLDRENSLPAIRKITVVMVTGGGKASVKLPEFKAINTLLAT